MTYFKGGLAGSDFIPSAAPSNAVVTGAFGQHLFELRNKPRFVWLVRVGLMAARDEAAQEKLSGSGAAFFFGFLLLAAQKKEPRSSGETDLTKILWIPAFAGMTGGE